MYTINLPFGRKRFVCDMCGYMSSDEDRLRGHEAIGVAETTELQAGETVEMFDRCWQGDRFIGLSEVRESWRVEAIFYSEPGFVTMEPMYPHDPLPPHTLCVMLFLSLHSGRPVFRKISYRDLQLWQEGDRAKLLAAGLIKELTIKIPLHRRILERVLSYA